MIRWCAYCQTYQGEVAPLESYELTHGVCDACSTQGKVGDDAAIAAIRPLARFHEALREQARDGFAASGETLLDTAVAIGVRPLDLLMGMLQPVLFEIGAAWERGALSVATEHRFTAAVESVASTARARMPRGTDARVTSSPDVLLVGANGNYHTLGLQVVDLILLSGGRTCLLVEPGLPTSEVIELARATTPKILGISVALVEHGASVEEVAAAVDRWPADARPRLLVGGHAVMRGMSFDAAPRVETCTDPRSLIAMASA